MAYAVIGRFIEGQIPVTAILPSLERAVLRLTTDNSEARTLRTDRGVKGRPPGPNARHIV